VHDEAVEFRVESGSGLLVTAPLDRGLVAGEGAQEEAELVLGDGFLLEQHVLN